MSLEKWEEEFVSQLGSLKEKGGWFLSPHGRIRQKLNRDYSYYCPIEALDREMKLPKLEVAQKNKDRICRGQYPSVGNDRPPKRDDRNIGSRGKIRGKDL